MSGDNIAVELQERSVLGKGLTQLRDDGHIPAVIHNHGKDSIHVMGDYTALTKMYAQAGKHHPVELKVAGKQHLALIKDADFEPTKHRLRHVVFQAIKQDEKVEAEIPLKVVGDAPAEKMSLMVLTQLDTVQVEALPKNLPDELTIDASTLAEVGDNLTVAGIVAPAGVTILTDPTQQIAIVEMPRDQVAEANAAAEALAEDAATGKAEDESAEAGAETEAKESDEEE